jgi:hypothetical protein
VRQAADWFGVAMSTVSGVMRAAGYRPHKVTIWTKEEQ